MTMSDDLTPNRARIVDAYSPGGVEASGLLDDVTRFAADLCAAPMSLVSLVEEEGTRFLAQSGAEGLEAPPRSLSFCTHAMMQDGLIEIRDATRDPCFAEHPFVTGDMHLRFYAGMPLRSHDGVPLGALCVLDTQARPEGLTALQRQGLTVLASLTMARLEDRRTTREQEAAREREAEALADSERRFRTLADAMPQMVWATLPDGYHDYYNARWYEFTGTPPGSTDGEGWNGMFHPDDQDRAWAVWRHSLETGAPYQIEYRLRHFDGTYRWVLGRALALRDTDGAITRWFGTCTDIHEQKLVQEEREVISQELSHRIKNIFAVISGLIGFAARGNPHVTALAADLRDRITALGRAHDFVRPHSAASRPLARQDSLHGLLNDLFLPYAQESMERLRVVGDDVRIDDRSATPLALLFHELATNASKYGALSTDHGCVTVQIDHRDAGVVLCWTETCGPRVDAAPAYAGFGSQLVELSAVRQLGGTVERDWRPEGLVVRVAVPVTAFSRG